MPSTREQRPAVVLSLDRTGLALVRALGRAGVDVSGITWREDDIGLRSRYLREGYPVPAGEGRDEAVLEALRAVAARGRPVLFPAEDDSIELVLLHWDEIKELADVPFPDDPDVVWSLRRKERLPGEAEKAGVPAPRTVLADGEEAIRSAELRPPLLVKPVEGREFEVSFKRKAFLAGSLDEAVSAWRQAQERGFETIVQELVPDANERIFSLFTYVARDGRPLVSVTGRKRRQLPLAFGSSTVFETEWIPRVFDLGHQLLAATGYRGFAHVEFAHDRRDGTFKLIEVNTRPPIWVSVATNSGSNIVSAAYEDLRGGTPPDELVLTERVAWVDLVRDLQLGARSRRFRPRESIAPYLSRRKARALFAGDDPGPVLALYAKVGRRAARRLRERK